VFPNFQRESKCQPVWAKVKIMKNKWTFKLLTNISITLSLIFLSYCSYGSINHNHRAIDIGTATKTPLSQIIIDTLENSPLQLPQTMTKTPLPLSQRKTSTSVPSPDLINTIILATLHKINEFGSTENSPNLEILLSIQKKCTNKQREIILNINFKNKTAEEIFLPNDFTISSMRYSLEHRFSILLYDIDKNPLISGQEYYMDENWTTEVKDVISIKPFSSYKLSIPYSFGDNYYYETDNFDASKNIPYLAGRYYIKMFYRNYNDKIDNKLLWKGRLISNTIEICIKR
jgi:hypothetical protein